MCRASFGCLGKSTSCIRMLSSLEACLLFWMSSSQFKRTGLRPKSVGIWDHHLRYVVAGESVEIRSSPVGPRRFSCQMFESLFVSFSDPISHHFQILRNFFDWFRIIVETWWTVYVATLPAIAIKKDSEIGHGCVCLCVCAYAYACVYHQLIVLLGWK